MARLTDEERVVDHLLKVGAASPADIRRALSLAESDTKEILQRLARDGRAQHEGRGRTTRWSLVETRPGPPPVEVVPVVEERASESDTSPGGGGHPGPVAATADALPSGGVEAVAPGGEDAKQLEVLRKAVAAHVGMSERADDGRLVRGLETMRANVRADRVALQETQDALAAARREAESAKAQRDEVKRQREAWEVHATSHEKCAIKLYRAITGSGPKVLTEADVAAAEADVRQAAAELARVTAECNGWQARAERALAEGQAAASPRSDGRIPYEVLEGRLAHYRSAWCDLAGAVTGTPTDPAGEHGELEMASVLAMAQRQRADLDTAADMLAIIERLVAERDEAREQRDELERRAEATDNALWGLRKRASRKLERARDRLAKAQNGLDLIESVPLASNDIPF